MSGWESATREEYGMSLNTHQESAGDLVQAEVQRIAKMAEDIAEEVAFDRVAQSPEDDDPLVMVDQAVDSMIAATQIIDENLPKVKVDSVPQKAAVDAVKDLMDTAIRPYLADIVKAMGTFGE
jgi:hypothetical protein